MTKVARIAVFAAAAAICGMTAVNSAEAYDKRILLVNQSHSTITQFFASNVGNGTWEYDLLGRFQLPPGYNVSVNLDDGSSYCRFDFMTVFRDGTKVVRRNVDVCSVSRYTLTD